MLTLSKATAATKSFFRWAAIGIGSILLLLILFRVFTAVKDKITPPAPPTVSFGKLPAITFPASQTNKNLSYSIDTVTGALPVFPDRESVFKTSKPLPDLLALDKTSSKISAAGFNGQPIQISDGLYQWTGADQNSGLSKKIIFDIFLGNFNLTSAYLSDSAVLSSSNLPNQTEAINKAQALLSSMRVLPNDVNLEKSQTSLFSIKNGTLIPATSLSNTQVVQVSFFQNDLNGIPVVYPNPNSSTINVFVGGGPSDPQVVKIDFFHQNIASESATYPILSSSQAYERLKNGDAYIASFDGKDSVSINKVSLGYYLSDQNQDYVLPVVVFQGNNGFTAYVSAVSDSWIQK